MKRRRVRTSLGRCVAIVAFALFAVWSGLGLWFQLEAHDVAQPLVVLTWLSLLFGCAVVAWRRPRSGATIAVVATLGYLAWWSSLSPRLDRDWTPEVARTVTGHANGDVVTLLNVRDFKWLSDSDAEEQWNFRRYDLSKLNETDVILSTWGMDAIAHTLVSFSFSDGKRVVFSAEIRRERGEAFSPIAGFFRTYELAMIAAEERDILYLRTNMRGESTFLYPLDIPQAGMRALFLSYLGSANQLAHRPRFYDTLTANCTTVVFDLARLVDPGLPLDWRILLSGYLPDYLAQRGVLKGEGTGQALRERAAISEIAQNASPGADYSAVIRSSN